MFTENDTGAHVPASRKVKTSTREKYLHTIYSHVIMGDKPSIIIIGTPHQGNAIYHIVHEHIEANDRVS